MTQLRLIGSMTRLIAIVLLLLSPLSITPATSQALPELSDSASLVMNSAQEKLFGKQVMLKIRTQSRFSGDLLLQDYLERLAGHLVRYSPRQFGELSVGFAVDPAINAFAVPGGYITANTGLLQNARNEDEFASVIAHEIGHQSQRHISRMIERSKQLTLPATAALLGGLLIGGQAGTAAIISAQAAVASDQLSYSRTFEREADATGISILAAAGYEPLAMPDFFSQLESQSRLYGGLVLEFLNTHPVSSDRIADGKSRASRLQVSGTPPQVPSDRLDFAHAQARCLALYEEPMATTANRFRHLLEKNAMDRPVGQTAAYGLALAYARQDEFAQAFTMARKLRATWPEKTLYQLLEAELALKSGDTLSAVDQYRTLYQSDTDHPAYIKGYAQALIYQGETQKAIKILRKRIRRNPENGWALQLLARAYADNDQTLNAVLTEARLLQLEGFYTRALQLLHQHKNQPHPDDSDYLKASIDSLIQQIEEEKRQLENFKL